MKIVEVTKNGIGYLAGVLKDKKQVVTKVFFWRIPHKTNEAEVNLKIGRYNKFFQGIEVETVESVSPRSELTLDTEELPNLILFLKENYLPFKDGITKYIPINEKFDKESVEHLKAFFENPDKQKLIEFIQDNNIVPDDLIAGLQMKKRIKAIRDFEDMIERDLIEQKWEDWFRENSWVLGSEFVEILDERAIDTAHITDYLMRAYDGFLDIIEIKRPEGNLRFWADDMDHGNCVPSNSLMRAITQAIKYIYEIEREANSIKFLERVKNTKTIKPRCILIFGRSNNWNQDQREAYRILNASYHNLTILTYDHVLIRAKKIIGLDTIVVVDSDNKDTPW